MRRAIPFAFVSLLLLFLVVPAQAQDLEGTWVLTYSRQARGGGQATEVTQEFTFEVAEDGTITGKTMMAMRGGRGGGGAGAAAAPQEVPLSDVKLEDGKLTFSVNRTFGERTMSTNYSATVTGNTMDGTFTMAGGMRPGGGGQPAATPFKGVKKEG
jgi:hypothetical protein